MCVVRGHRLGLLGNPVLPTPTAACSATADYKVRDSHKLLATLHAAFNRCNTSQAKQ
jgi:hypothetical protein